MSTPAPGWYPDPLGQAELRYWDGSQWTENTHPVAAAAAQQPQTFYAQQVETQTEPQKPAYTPTNPVVRATAPGLTPSGRDIDQPGIWMVGLIAFLTQLIVGVAMIVVVFVVSLLGVASFSKIGVMSAIMLLVVFGIIITGYVWLTAKISVALYRWRGWEYRSQWNLLAGFIWGGLAYGVAYSLIVGVLGALLGSGGGIMFILFLLSIPAYLYIYGYCLNMANRWQEETGQWVTFTVIGFGVSLAVTVLLFVAVIGTTIKNLNGGSGLNPTQQMQQGPQNIPGLTPEQKQQMEKQMQQMQQGITQ